jgi:hypothetical protein
LVEGAAGLGVCATRGQPDMRGLATAGPGFVFRARRLATGVTDLRSVAHRCVTDALARRALARRLLDQRVLWLGQSAVATAQQNPASSRAAATAMMVRRLLRCSIRCQT